MKFKNQKQSAIYNPVYVTAYYAHWHTHNSAIHHTCFDQQLPNLNSLARNMTKKISIKKDTWIAKVEGLEVIV